MDTSSFFDRGLARSPWFWSAVIGAGVVVVSAVYLVIRKGLYSFRGVYLLTCAFLVVFELYASLGAYRQLQRQDVEWRRGEPDHGAVLRECCAQSILRGTHVCIYAALFAILALR